MRPDSNTGLIWASKLRANGLGVFPLPGPTRRPFVRSFHASRRPSWQTSTTVVREPNCGFSRYVLLPNTAPCRAIHWLQAGKHPFTVGYVLFSDKTCFSFTAGPILAIFVIRTHKYGSSCRHGRRDQMVSPWTASPGNMKM